MRSMPNNAQAVSGPGLVNQRADSLDPTQGIGNMAEFLQRFDKMNADIVHLVDRINAVHARSFASELPSAVQVAEYPAGHLEQLRGRIEFARSVISHGHTLIGDLETFI